MKKSKLENLTWKLFVTRPATLLERTLRFYGYHLAGLKHLVVVSNKGVCQNFVVTKEWDNEVEKAVRLLQSDKLKSKFDEFEKRFLAIKKQSPTETLQFYSLYGQVTAVIIFCHFLELAVDQNQKFYKYRKKVGYFHNTARQLIDQAYDGFLALAKEPLDWYTPNEVIQFIKTEKNLPTKIVEARKKYYWAYSDGASLTVKVGKEAINVARKFTALNIKKPLSKSEVRGMVAQPGKAKGKVVIIYTPNDLKKINQDMIIICPMTEPRMFPFLKKVKGIITDEGGLTSHAAIISRELKIPCIISTQFATSIFKSGDFIEVDATNGVAKKLK